MIDIGYGLYMSGQLDSPRKQKINKLIKEIKDYPNEVMPDLVFYSLCEKNGIACGTLTEEEMEAITDAIQ